MSLSSSAVAAAPAVTTAVVEAPSRPVPSPAAASRPRRALRRAHRRAAGHRGLRRPRDAGARRAAPGLRHLLPVTQAPSPRRRLRRPPVHPRGPVAAGRVLGTQDVTAADAGPSPRRPGCATPTLALPVPRPRVRALDARRRLRGRRRRRRPVTVTAARGPAGGEQLRLLRRLGEARRELPLADHRHQPDRHPVSGATVTVTAPAARRITERRRARPTTSPPATHRHLGRARRRRRSRPATLVLESRAAPLDGQRPRSSGATCPRAAVDRRRRSDAGRQPRPQGDPARGDLRHRPVRRPPVPGRPGPVHRPRLPGRPLRRRPRAGHQRPGQAGLDLQPLPGDVARAALPPRHRALGGHRHRRLQLRARASTSPDAEPGQTCTGADHADSPSPAEGTPLYPERITDGVYNLPGNTGYYGADANGSAVDRLARRRRRAAEHRLRLRTRRQDGLRRRGDRRPGDRLLRLRHRQGRRGRLLHGRLRRLRRQRRLPARRRRLRLHRRALRQRLAALLLAGVLLHRPGHRAPRLHHRRPAQGPRGPAALVHRRQPYQT